MVIMFRMFEFENIFSPMGLINIALISIVAPRAEALITARHGYMMLQDRRWGAVLRSAFWRASLLVGLYFVVFNPEGWVFILPFIMLANPSAEKWIWESVPRKADVVCAVFGQSKPESVPLAPPGARVSPPQLKKSNYFLLTCMLHFGMPIFTGLDLKD